MKPATLAPAFAFLVPTLMEAARSVGYALALHGTMARDLDLVAIPWTEGAVSAEELVAILAKTCGGWVATEARESAEAEPDPLPRCKPHGRKAWLIFLRGGPYLDLSVMPRQAA